MHNNIHTVVISVGSNVADSKRNVARALRDLAILLPGGDDSGVYLTTGVNDPSRLYANGVMWGSYAGTAEKLTALLKDMERDAGRDELARSKGEVPLDLDLVIFDGQIIRPSDYARDYFRKGWDGLCRRPPVAQLPSAED